MNPKSAFQNLELQPLTGQWRKVQAEWAATAASVRGQVMRRVAIRSEAILSGAIRSFVLGESNMSYRSRGNAAKRLLMLSALPLAMLATSLQAQTQTPTPTSTPVQNSDSQWDSRWSSGKNLYEKVCAHCHAPEVGVGTVIEGRGLPDVYIKYVVRNGFNAMPAFPASYIDDHSITLVAEYLASLPTPPAKP